MALFKIEAEILMYGKDEAEATDRLNQMAEYAHCQSIEVESIEEDDEDDDIVDEDTKDDDEDEDEVKP